MMEDGIAAMSEERAPIALTDAVATIFIDGLIANRHKLPTTERFYATEIYLQRKLEHAARNALHALRMRTEVKKNESWQAFEDEIWMAHCRAEANRIRFNIPLISR